MHRLLIVDDDAQLLRALSITLGAFDYSVLTCASGAEALDCAATNPVDLVLLDLGLPDMDGTTVIRVLRAWSDVPIIVLSGRDDPTIKTDALDTGADDYVTKPFAMNELHARIRATLRRSQTSTRSSTRRARRVGEWLIDTEAHAITAIPGRTASRSAGSDPRVDRGSNEATVSDSSDTAGDRDAIAPHLTPTEWRLLEILLGRPGALIDAYQLLDAVWGRGHEHSKNYLRSYFFQLRAKLERDPSRPQHLITEAGMGYRYLP